MKSKPIYFPDNSKETLPDVETTVETVRLLDDGQTIVEHSVVDTDDRQHLHYTDFSMKTILQTGTTELLRPVGTIQNPSLQSADALEVSASVVVEQINNQPLNENTENE